MLRYCELTQVRYSGRALHRACGRVALLPLFVNRHCSNSVVHCYGCLCSTGWPSTFSLVAVLFRMSRSGLKSHPQITQIFLCKLRNLWKSQGTRNSASTDQLIDG